MRQATTAAITALICLFLFQAPVRAETKGTETITLWEHLWEFRRGIEILLDHTIEDYGPYELKKSPPMEQGRALHELESGDAVDLLSLPCSLEREKRFLPVYIYMGGQSLGYRVCLIRQGTQHLFDGINSLQDWRDSGLIMGSGTHWADTQILTHNGINVSTNPIYENLYKQLDKGRFQAFPRGIDQIRRKLETYGPGGAGFDITVEQRLLFVYPFRSIIFVNRKNPELKKRLEDGYQRALEDGSWQQSFDNEPDNEYDWLGLKQRVLIPLDNPFLSPKALSMPLFDKSPLD